MTSWPDLSGDPAAILNSPSSSKFSFSPWPFPKVSSRLTYGCNPECPRLPLWQYRVWVSSNCHCSSAAFNPTPLSATQRAAVCPVSHVSMTFTKDCCILPLLCLLSRCQVSVWVGGCTQTDGEVKTSAHKTQDSDDKEEEEGTEGNNKQKNSADKCSWNMVAGQEG